MLVSDTQKTGKGGRPSRLYRLSEDVIQLNFPFRDYQLLSKIAIQTMISLGDIGKKAMYDTGKRFGKELIDQEKNNAFLNGVELSFNQKLEILKKASTVAGFYPEFETNDDKTKIFFQIFNCPFKEVALEHSESVCNMHFDFLIGMFESLFGSVELVEKENIITGCDSCSYHAIIAK